MLKKGPTARKGSLGVETTLYSLKELFWLLRVHVCSYTWHISWTTKNQVVTTWPANSSRLKEPLPCPHPWDWQLQGGCLLGVLALEGISPPGAHILVGLHCTQQRHVQQKSPCAKPAQPPTTRALIPEQRGAGQVMLQHRDLLILIHTIQEKLGHRAFWSNHKDMGVGHEQQRRKWNFKKSVLKKITLCKPDFCEPSTCNREMFCYSPEATVNRGSVSSWQGLQNQNTPGRWESSLPGVNCEQSL